MRRKLLALMDAEDVDQTPHVARSFAKAYDMRQRVSRITGYPRAMFLARMNIPGADWWAETTRERAIGCVLLSHRFADGGTHIDFDDVELADL